MESTMSEQPKPHPMDAVVAAIGVKNVARAFGEALERLLDAPGGEDRFVAYLELLAAERKAVKDESLTPPVTPPDCKQQ